MIDRDVQCRKCGACCRGNGYVRLAPADIDALAEHLEMSVPTFVEKYTRLTHDRRSLALIDNDDQSCIFLNENNLCTVYTARPIQCQRFPQHWYYRGVEKECQAVINHGAAAP